MDCAYSHHNPGLRLRLITFCPTDKLLYGFSITLLISIVLPYGQLVDGYPITTGLRLRLITYCPTDKLLYGFSITLMISIVLPF